MAESKLYLAFREFLYQVQKYPVNQISYDGQKNAQKKEDAAIKLCDPLYNNLHTKFGSIFNDVQSSVLLIQNEQSAPLLVKESAQFAAYLDFLISKLSSVKAVPELTQYYQFIKIKGKDVLDMLMLDLTYFSEKYSFELDKKEVAENFKIEKQNFLNKLNFEYR